MVGGECPGTRLRGSSPLPPQMRVRSGDSPSLLSTILLCPRTKEKLVQSAGQGGRLLKWGHQQSERWLEAWFEDGVGRAKEGGAGTVCGAGPASSRGAWRAWHSGGPGPRVQAYSLHSVLGLE